MSSFNLEMAVQDDKVIQDFELESLLIGVDHSQKVKATPIRSDYGSKDCVNLSSSTVISRLSTPSASLTFFSHEQMALLDKTKVPKHVAIIPDGNRRWAKREEFHSNDGHRHGADILMDIVKSGRELGIKTMTFYTFSTENWHRDKEEVAALMWLLQTYLSDKCNEMIEWGIRFQCIGDLSKLPVDLYHTIQETKLATSTCDKIDMVLAVNYGSRDEICRAIQSIAVDFSKDKIDKESITADLVSSYLDTHGFDDPELLIRTSGEMRISNFLLWQLSYSEIYVSNVLWPDYRPYHLFEAVYNYQQRERRLGRS